jgi:hypothetical protein
LVSVVVPVAVPAVPVLTMVSSSVFDCDMNRIRTWSRCAW